MLELNLSLMFIVLAFFFTLLFLLNKILFQPMLFFIENRDDNLNSNSKDIENIEKSIKLINLESNNLLKNNNIEVNLLIENATNEIKKDISYNIKIKVENLNQKYIELMDKFSKENLVLKDNLSLEVNEFKQDINNKFNNLEDKQC